VNVTIRTAPWPVARQTSITRWQCSIACSLRSITGLRPADPQPDVQPCRQFSVVERVESSRRAVSRLAGTREAEKVAAQRDLAGGRHRQRTLAERRRALECLLGPAHHVLVAVLVGAARGELDHQRHAIDRRRIGDPAKGAVEPCDGVAVAPEQVLDAGAERDHRHAPGVLGR